MAMKKLWIPMRCSDSAELLVATFIQSDYQWLLMESDLAEGGSGSTGHYPIEGEFGVDPGYRGCARCGLTSYVRCGRCEHLSCDQGGQGHNYHCPWCGTEGPVEGTIRQVRATDTSG